MFMSISKFGIASLGMVQAKKQFPGHDFGKFKKTDTTFDTLDFND